MTKKPSCYPVKAENIEWVPLREGLSFRPLHFAPDGYSLQLRLEPGTTIAPHRHTGEVNAFQLSGSREIIDTGEIIGPGTFLYEPRGNHDTWRSVGDEPCIIQISVKGRVEYIDADGHLLKYTDTFTAQAAYLAWCAERNVAPHPSLVRGIERCAA